MVNELSTGDGFGERALLEAEEVAEAAAGSSSNVGFWAPRLTQTTGISMGYHLGLHRAETDLEHGAPRLTWMLAPRVMRA